MHGDLRSESSAADPTASASADPRQQKQRRSDAQQHKQCYQIGVKDRGGAAGFASPKYSTLDDSEVDVPTDIGKAIDNFLVLDGLRTEDISPAVILLLPG